MYPLTFPNIVGKQCCQSILWRSYNVTSHFLILLLPYQCMISTPYTLNQGCPFANTLIDTKLLSSTCSKWNALQDSSPCPSESAAQSAGCQQAFCVGKRPGLQGESGQTQQHPSPAPACVPVPSVLQVLPVKK